MRDELGFTPRAFAAPRMPERTGRLDWASRLQSVVRVDVLKLPFGGQRKGMALIPSEKLARHVIAKLTVDATGPPNAKACGRSTSLAS